MIASVLVDWLTHQVNANETANCTPITSTDANMCGCQTQVLILTIHLLVNHIFIYFPFGGLALFIMKIWKCDVSHIRVNKQNSLVHVWCAHAFTIIKLFHCVHRICTIDGTHNTASVIKYCKTFFSFAEISNLNFFNYIFFFLRLPFSLSLDVLPKIY